MCLKKKQKKQKIKKNQKIKNQVVVVVYSSIIDSNTEITIQSCN
jgi:hypothetical protein